MSGTDAPAPHVSGPLSVDLTASELHEEHQARAKRGESLCSIAMRGDEVALHTVAWALRAAGSWTAPRASQATPPSTNQPPQRLELDLQAPRAPAVLARHARDGFFPAMLAMTGPAENLRLAIVLEPCAGTPPRFFGPLPFHDASGTFFLRALDVGDDLLLRCVAAAGKPRRADGGDLLVCGVFWPQPRTHVTWAVHLDVHDASHGTWTARPETRALGGVARPVQVLPLVAGDGELRLSLWHDTQEVPWPALEPLAPRAAFQLREGLLARSLDSLLRAEVIGDDRAIISVSVAERDPPTWTLLLGAAGQVAPQPRRRVAVEAREPREEASVRVSLGDPVDEETTRAVNPLDAWMWAHMARTGSRHAQLVVVRGSRLAKATAYTLAEEGYPVATLDHSMRIGSVTKLLTALALLAATDRADGNDSGLDRRALDVTGEDKLASEAPRLATVTLRHLLAHDAGLGSFGELRPDDPLNPLSEARVARLAGRADSTAMAGDLSRALRARPSDDVLVRAPGRGDAELHYSNEGYIWLGEIVSMLARGDEASFEDALADLVWRPARVEPATRGSLLANGLRASIARGESPPHPLSPTWRRRTSSDGRDEIALSTFADNGPFLGGAAGVAVPLLWLARVGRAISDPTVTCAPFRDADRRKIAAPTAPGANRGHGAFLGATAWWTHRPRAGLPTSTRVVRMHHNGRVDGGACLLIHQTPAEDGADPDAALTLVVAENQLGPLYEEPQGRELLAILKQLEGSPGWNDADAFEP